jgi:hypothetical protein
VPRGENRAVDAHSTSLLAGAALAFATAAASSAGAWRAGVVASGGDVGLVEACARYGIGSLANTFLPGRAGDAVRVGLFARALSDGRKLGACRIFGAVGLARAATLALLAASTRGTAPFLFAAVVLGLAAPLARRCTRLVAWAALSTGARVAAVTAVSAAFDVPRPFAAALVLVPALDLAGAIQLLPANLGVASGTVAAVLHARGLPLSAGVAAGIGLHAVETGTSVCFGLAGAAFLSVRRVVSARLVAVLDDLPAELLLVGREEVVHAVGLADVVEVVDARRLRGSSRAPPSSAVASPESRAVAQRRVDRERHSLRQAVVDDRCDERPLLRRDLLALEGGEL